MKTWLIVTAAAVILASCKTAAYFETPNDLSYISGTLYLSNGRSLDGKISVSEGGNGVVKIYLPGEKKAQKYVFAEVEGYKIRNEYYELKEIRDGGSFSNRYRLHFMKRLTPDDSKMHLYEYLDEETSYSGYRRTRPVTSLEKEYYLQLPAEKQDGVWEIGLSKFVPNFDEKMSRIVDDCPVLSQKIANKEKGYFYPQVGGSEEKRVDMLWKIINEYNKCR
ncbi:MAG: hypothetical protein ACHQFX_02005 [Chitinophagales bacterium]